MEKITKVWEAINKILTKKQLNIIYLGSSIKDIQNGNEQDGSIYIQYMTDIQKVMEKKEQYEICEEIQQLLQAVEQKRVNN